MTTRVAIIGTLLVLLFALTGCGSSGGPVVPPPAKPEFLYTVAASGTPPSLNLQMVSFVVDTSTGALSNASTVAWTNLYPNFAIDSSSTFLYASEPQTDSVLSFSLDPSTGVPKQSGSFMIPTGICAFCPPNSLPGYVALDPTGKYLFYGSSTFGLPSQNIGSLSINGGSLTAVSGSPFPANQMPFWLSVHPSGQFVFTEDLSGAGPGGFIAQSVSSYAVDSSGALSPVAGSPFLTPANTHEFGLLVHPSGKFLYAPMGGTNGIAAWSVDANGGLTQVSGSPFEQGVTLLGGAFEPTGKFLYLSGGAAGGMLGFSVDANTGALNPLPGSPFDSGSVVGVPAVDPSGKFVFAADFQTIGIDTFKIDTATGALGPPSGPIVMTARPGQLIIVKGP